MRYNYFRCDAVLHATTAMLKRIDASVASGSVGASGQRRLGRQLIGPESVLPRKSAAGACVNIFWAVLPVGIMAGLLGVDQAAVGADRTKSRQILSQVLPGQVLPGQVPAVPVPESQVPAVPIPAAPTATAPRAATPQLPYTLTYTSHLTVRADRTATDLFTRRLKILTPFALGLLSQQSATFVEGMETLETVEAFTEKPDGTKIPVDPANIITRDAATGLQATFARDLKQRTVIFQDVQVGDTLVWTGHKETLQGLFPGQFFYAELVSAGRAGRVGRDCGRSSSRAQSPGQGHRERFQRSSRRCCRRPWRHAPSHDYAGKAFVRIAGGARGGAVRRRSAGVDLDLQVLR